MNKLKCSVNFNEQENQRPSRDRLRGFNDAKKKYRPRL